ncbi:MAG: SUMF1/EgtB/PvdO family nonheme iron enzyme [Flavobacteriales bacterium]|nr:SUMF1/EgtB/PvdO family nonheme iron enzyme [Flavobacteriales bacterium]
MRFLIMYKPIIYLICLLNYCLASSKPKIDIPHCKPIIGNFLWMSETEVSNIQYARFLNSIAVQHGTKLYDDVRIYDSLWNQNGRYMKFYEEYYSRHPGFSEYPVVNISHNGMMLYCRWLQKELNEQFSGEDGILEVEVRLPNEYEWELAANNSKTASRYPWGTDKLRKNGKYLANYRISRGDYISDQADITCPVYSFGPNRNGFYNLAGNAAELLFDGASTKGGSWASSSNYLETQKKHVLREDQLPPNPTIGFRYVVEITKFCPPIDEIKQLSFKDFNKSLVQVSDSLWVYNQEITNSLFQQFVNTRNEEKPYSNLWQQFEYGRHLESIYFNAYPDRPVVNISFEQAHEFCNWLNSLFQGHLEKRNLRIQLPSQEQWKTIYYHAETAALHQPALPNIHYNKARLDFKHDLDNEIIPTQAYRIKNKEIYHMKGNVSEILSDGSIVSSNWTSNQLDISVLENSIGPEVGFRVIVTIPPENPDIFSENASQR